jgi:hypothetical protein
MDETQGTPKSCCAPPVVQQPTSCCCCGAPSVVTKYLGDSEASWVVGEIDTPAGRVPRVSTTLELNDKLGAWKVRWGIGRTKFRVQPGLYAVGNPTPESNVVVSANFKMSFDRLRSELSGINAWILVLDTKGINVWCAAGKGTFGTDEIVNRVQSVELDKVVSHHKLILPQLSAPGVRALHVRQRSGFKVIYGPVRASDLPQFLRAGMKASPEMRRVRFPIVNRIALIPVELVNMTKYALLIAAGFFVLAGFYSGGYSIQRMLSIGSWSAAVFVVGCILAASLTPALLPWLPGRSFSVKGAAVGLVFALAISAYALARPVPSESPIVLVGWLLMLPAVTGFLAFNFTGASTYTSLSGVKKEMRVAVPVQIVAAVIGFGLWITGRFV